MTGLITHEKSQMVANAFNERGHWFCSNDLQETSGNRPDRHYKGDCFYCIREFKKKNGLDFLGCHPNCTFLTNSSIGWLVRKKPTKGYEWSEKHQRFVNWKRWELMDIAAHHFIQCLDEVKSVGKGYVENPIMHPYAMEIIGIKPTQIIQPWMFGHMEQKATCLWIVGLPEIKETNNVYDEMMKLKHSERNRIHYLSPGNQRSELRAKTLSGPANAFAEQWG